MSGPGPSGSGPAARAEAARRALYAPGRSAGAVEEYERLVAQVPPAPARPPRTIRSLHALPRLLVVAVLGTVVAGALAFPPIPPDYLPPPPKAPGTTLIAYSRQHVAGTGPGIISYQPSGYQVYPAQPAGIRVDLSCAGIGEVLVSADARFTFHCGRATQTLTQVNRTAGRSPFVIVGTTHGDVVWSVRVTALPQHVERLAECAACTPAP